MAIRLMSKALFLFRSCSPTLLIPKARVFTSWRRLAAILIDAGRSSSIADHRIPPSLVTCISYAAWRACVLQ